MRAPIRIKHEFVEFIPKERQEGVLYVSIPYATAVHNCFCGCGLKVVTPISPVGWQLTFDGETVTLSPSVGSWRFPCRSHYFIRHDAAVWAGNMSQDEIYYYYSGYYEYQSQQKDRAVVEVNDAAKPAKVEIEQKY